MCRGSRCSGSAGPDMLKLPAYSQLSREQVAIDDLPADGNYLVYGPPGTGKTVMALYRSSRLRRGKRRTQFLSYGKPLSRYIRQAVSATNLDGSASTLHQWFWGWWRRLYGSRPPMLPGSEWDHDWLTILQRVGNVPEDARLDNLIVDEGQDLPPSFYLAIQLIASNVTVFADENQSIRETNSTLKDINDYLNPRQTCALRRNYRNSRPIAQLAREYYTGTQSGLPDLPDRNGSLPQLLTSAPLTRQVTYLADFERLHSNQDTGVFVERVDTIRELQRLLSNRTVNPVQAYARSIHGAELDFSRPGIKLLTFQSAKGLEFDSVFFPTLERTRRLLDDRGRMNWYVLVSRAREEVLFMTAEADVPVTLRGISAGLYESQSLARPSQPGPSESGASRPQQQSTGSPAARAITREPSLASPANPAPKAPARNPTPATPNIPQPVAGKSNSPATEQDLAGLVDRFTGSRNQSRPPGGPPVPSPATARSRTPPPQTNVVRQSTPTPSKRQSNAPVSDQELARLVERFNGSAAGSSPSAQSSEQSSRSSKPTQRGRAPDAQGRGGPLPPKGASRSRFRCPRCGVRGKRGALPTSSGLCLQCARKVGEVSSNRTPTWLVRCPVCGHQEVRSDGSRPPRGQKVLLQNCVKCGNARGRCSRCGALPPKPLDHWITGICRTCQQDTIPVSCATCGWQTTRARVHALAQCPACGNRWREARVELSSPGRFETWREDTK